MNDMDQILRIAALETQRMVDQLPPLTLEHRPRRAWGPIIGVASAVTVLALFSGILVTSTRPGVQGNRVPPTNSSATNETDALPSPVNGLPADPDLVVHMLPGRSLSDGQRAWLEEERPGPGYVEGSARITSVYPGSPDEYEIITWQEQKTETKTPQGSVFDFPDSATPASDLVTWRCRSVVLAGGIPTSGGCTLDVDRYPGLALNPDGILLVDHDPSVVAIVFQDDDGSTAIVYPVSEASLINWPNHRIVEVTIYFPDGTTHTEDVTHMYDH